MRYVRYPEEYKDWINRPVRQFDFYMEFNGSTVTTSEVSSIKITSDLLPSDTFTIGTSAADTLEFSLLIDSDTLIDTSIPVKPYISLYTEVEMEDGSIAIVWQKTCLGVFYINSDGITKKGLRSINIKASSMLSHPDYGGRTYVAADPFNKNSIIDVANDVCNKLGIECITKDLPTNVYINHRDNINGMTCRDVVNHIAMLYGGYARISNDGKLQFFKMYDTGYTYTTSDYISLTKEDKTLNVKKFICAVNDEATLVSGSGLVSETVEISNTDMTKYLLDEIMYTYSGFSYSPIKCKIFGNPAFEVGDIIEVVDVKGHTHKLPIQSATYNLSGNGLTMDVKSIYTVNSISKGTSIRKVVNEINEEIVKTNIMIANELEVVYGSIEDLKVTKADVEELIAVKAQIEELNVTSAHIENLTTDKADIKELNAVIADVEDIKTNKANVSDMNAISKSVSDVDKNLDLLEAAVADTYATKEELSNKSDEGHVHEQYLTEHQDISNLIDSETMNQALSSKSDEGHIHEEYLTEHQDISHLATTEAVGEALEGKSDTDHTHEEMAQQILDLSNLVSSLQSRIEALEGNNGEDNGDDGGDDGEDPLI